MELFGPSDNYENKIKPEMVGNDSVKWIVNGVSKTAPIIFIRAELDIRKAFDVEGKTTSKKKLNKREFKLAKEIDYTKKEDTYKEQFIMKKIAMQITLQKIIIQGVFQGHY